jgi:hypothetical protein
MYALSASRDPIMLITRFNRLIRNKFVWAVFAFFISLSFVVYFAPQGQGGARDNDVVLGKVFGEDIRRSDISKARIYASGLRPDRSSSAEYERLLTEAAWRRLAALHVAGELGFETTDDELRDRIVNDDTFAHNGTFNKEKYQLYIRRGFRVTEEIYEDYFRENVTLEKVYRMLNTCLWLPPAFLTSRVAQFTDRFQAQYVIKAYNPDSYTVELDEVGLRQYYDENTERYRVPEKISVAWIHAPIDTAATDVSTDTNRVQSYYNTNLDEFRFVVTNTFFLTETNIGVLPLLVVSSNVTPTFVTNIVSTTNTTFESNLFTFAEAYDDISSQLGFADATRRAQDVAATFMDRLIPEEGTVMSFNDAATELGFNVSTSRTFSRFEKLEELGVGLNFNAEAFSLDLNEDRRTFSDPIIGTGSVFVLTLLERQDSHIPAFEMLSENISPDAAAAERERLFQEECDALHEDIRAALVAGRSFAESVASADLNVVTTETFSLAGQYFGSDDELENAEQIIPVASDWHGGELAPLEKTDEGSMLLYVASREQGDDDSRQNMRNLLLRQLNEQMMNLQIGSWEAQIVDQARRDN